MLIGLFKSVCMNFACILKALMSMYQFIYLQDNKRLLLDILNRDSINFFRSEFAGPKGGPRSNHRKWGALGKIAVIESAVSVFQHKLEGRKKRGNCGIRGRNLEAAPPTTPSEGRADEGKTLTAAFTDQIIAIMPFVLDCCCGDAGLKLDTRF